MTEKELRELLCTAEPLFTFRGVEYQICVLNRILAGLADDESQDCWFDTVDDLLDNWTLDGVPLRRALPEIS